MEVEPANGRDSAGNTKQGVALPAGWEEMQDADGKTYYVDQIIRITQLQHPGPGITELEEVAAEASLSEPSGVSEEERESIKSDRQPYNMRDHMSVDENQRMAKNLHNQSIGVDPSSAAGWGSEQRCRTQSGSDMTDTGHQTSRQTLPEDSGTDQGNGLSSPKSSTSNLRPVLQLRSAPPSPLPFFANGCKAPGSKLLSTLSPL